MLTAHEQGICHETGRPPVRRRRVLLVSSTLHVGGAERVIADLAQALDRQRFEVTACYLKENGVVGQDMIEAGVRLLPIPGLVEGRLDRFTWIKLRRLIRELDIQLIHTHDIHGLMDGAMCRLTFPRVRHVHTFHFGNYRAREPRYRRIEKLAWRMTSATVAVGHAQAATIHEVLGIPLARLPVIWNGVRETTPEICEPIQRTLQGVDVPVIASISTLIEQKGLHHLLNAAHILRQSGRKFLLLMIGEGKLRSELEAQTASLGLQESVRFFGWIPDAARKALPACDIFVQSSLWEAMSIAVLEAMAAAKPMVITDVGDNARVIQHERTGLVVPPADPERFAQELGRLLDDVDLRNRLARQARQEFEARFTLPNMIRQYESLYESLIPEKQARAPLAAPIA